MFGMALMAVLMSVSLTSCSKDENQDGSEDFSNEKKLVKIIEDDSEEVYRYDDMGRVIEILYNGEISASYVWSDDVVKEIYGTNIKEYTLANSRIQGYESNSGTYGSYTYDSYGKLLIFNSDYWNERYVWTGDKVTSVTHDIDRSDYEPAKTNITYDKSCKKGYFPMFMYMVSREVLDISWAHPELFGLRSSLLPSTITYSSKDHNEFSTFTYEFDKDGYISKFTWINERSGSSIVTSTDTRTYTLIWE